MAATTENLEAVLTAAKYLLGARQDQMLTIEEWTALARAVAACTGQRTADLLTERDLQQVPSYDVQWDPAVDGPLPELEGG